MGDEVKTPSLAQRFKKWADIPDKYEARNTAVSIMAMALFAYTFYDSQKNNNSFEAQPEAIELVAHQP